MWRHLRGSRIALFISLTLHLIAFLTFRGVRFYSHSIGSPIGVNVDLLDSPSSKPQPPQKITEIDKRILIPARRTLRTGITPGMLSPKVLPARQITVKVAGENRTYANIPVIDTNASIKQLPDPLSSSASSVGSAMNVTSMGRGVGRGFANSGSETGRDKKNSDSIIPRRKISSHDNSIGEKLQIYKDADIPFIKALQKIALHILNIKINKKVDIAFIIDISESMQNDIDAIRRHLFRMIETFKVAGIDFTLGVVTFHYNVIYDWLGTDIEITQQTRDVEVIEDRLTEIKVSANERALDALMQSITKVKFRPGADKHFILVTDEYVSGTYAVSDVLKAAKRAKIAIDVMGRDEPFQRTIAEQTGGVWMPVEKAEEE